MTCESVADSAATNLEFAFQGVNEYGEAVFFNVMENALIVREGNDALLKAYIPALLGTGEEFSIFASGLAIAGAPPGSAYDDGLGAVDEGWVNAAFVVELYELLVPGDLRYYFTMQVVPTENLAVVTDNFTRDGSIEAEVSFFLSERIPDTTF